MYVNGVQKYHLAVKSEVKVQRLLLIKTLKTRFYEINKKRKNVFNIYGGD